MRIGVIGAGRMGGTLGHLWAQAGHDVTFSYARQSAKLDRLAERAGPNARAGSVASAVIDADAVLLAVHWSRIDDVLAQAGDMGGKTILTCCVPLDASDTRLVVGRTDSGAEHLARLLPDARIVAAFQTTPSEVLSGVFARRAAQPRPNCVLCGDDTSTKTLAAGLIADVGFDPVDAGRLAVARYTEPFAMLTAALAYGTNDGPDWAYRFGKLPTLMRG